MGMSKPKAAVSAAALALTALVLAASAPASADIYKCYDAAGHMELTDINKAGCKKLDLPGILAPPKKWNGAQRPGVPMAPASSAGYPKIDSAMQKARDADRRQILQDELDSEEKKLADLQKAFNGGEPDRLGNERNYAKYQARVEEMRADISRTEKNIEALKRELASVK